MDKQTTKKMQSRIKTMNLADKYRLSQRKNRELTTEIKLAKKELSIAQDFIATLTTENLQLGHINEDLRNRFMTGGIAYTINNGYVSSAIEIKPISEWTYTQEIPKEIGTALYSKIPFVKVVDRQLTIDTKQKNKYKGAIL